MPKISGHPPLLSFEDTERGVRTILPSSLAQSFSWNLDLVERGARMAARKSAAVGLSGILGPVSDHSCTTRNGRSMETKGESPYLTARYVERIVRGFQGASLKDPDTVAATLKHWIGYQCSDDGTDYRGADISELELLETHAPPFEAGFKAGAALFMPAFTQLNGMPMHMNAACQRPPARPLGGAHAVSIGDHTGDVELIEHGVAGDLCDAALKAFEGGLHISLEGGLYLPCLPDLVARGRLARADGRSAGGRGPAAEGAPRPVPGSATLRAAGRGGTGPPQPGASRDRAAARPGSAGHADQAGTDAAALGAGHPDPGDRPARRQPLRPCSASGARADGLQDVVTPCAGLARFFGRDQVSCVPIGAVERIRGDELAAAVAAAARVDAIVLMLGEARYMSGEAAARLYPEIPLAQYRLVEALQGVGKPLIAIQTAGRAVPVSRLAGLLPEMSGSADVVFFTSQLGIEAGNAIADVLGGAHPPSGRLSLSLPCESGIISATFRERRDGRPQSR